jgi:serine/threonine protein kinase
MGFSGVYQTSVVIEPRRANVSLAKLIEHDTLEAVDVVAIVHRVAELLEQAHRRGICHANLRPTSIVLRGDDLRVVGWAGLATPGRFTAPEIHRGAAPDARADIYSLGAIAICALLGNTVRTAPTLVMMLLGQMLAADPARRPTSAKVRAATAYLSRVIDRDETVIDFAPISEDTAQMATM